MNPIWLIRNLFTSLLYGETRSDALKRLRWLYGDRIPARWRFREQVIGFRFPPPVGLVRIVARANGGSDAFIFGEVFHHKYYRFQLKSEPQTILDLGANAGFAAVFFARIYPHARIACVEPVPDNLRVLARNLELNGVNAAIIPAAVHITDGRVMMELKTMDYAHKIAAPTMSPRRTVQVDACTISTIMRRLGWQRIGLLKIDIEGHEKALLAADCEWLRHVDNVGIECHDETAVDELKEVTSQYGFRPPVYHSGLWLVSR